MRRRPVQADRRGRILNHVIHVVALDVPRLAASESRTRGSAETFPSWGLQFMNSIYNGLRRRRCPRSSSGRGSIAGTHCFQAPMCRLTRWASSFALIGPGRSWGPRTVNLSHLPSTSTMGRGRPTAGVAASEMLEISWDTSGLATNPLFAADGQSMFVTTAAVGNQAILAKLTDAGSDAGADE
jgi:hypothetical protein